MMLLIMIVNCTSYKNGKKISDIPAHSLKSISDILKDHETIIWLALKEPTQDELDLICEEFNLHFLAIEDVMHGYQRIKIEEYGEVIFTVLRTPEFKNDHLHFGDIYLFVGPQFVISIRKNTDNGFINIRERCEKEPHLLALGSGFIFYALVDTIVDRYFPIVDKLEEEFETLEEKMFQSSSSKDQIEQLYNFKQTIMRIKHTLNPLIESVGKLYGGRVPKVCSQTQEYFRDVYDHVFRLEQTVDNIRDMLVTAMQVNLNLISLRESETNKRLAAWAALIGFPTMIAGVYGMNFKHMPELEWEYSYPVILILMASLDIYLYFKFKRTGWL